MIPCTEWFGSYYQDGGYPLPFWLSWDPLPLDCSLMSKYLNTGSLAMPLTSSSCFQLKPLSGCGCGFGVPLDCSQATSHIAYIVDACFPLLIDQHKNVQFTQHNLKSKAM
jgi:hypothetical protein